MNELKLISKYRSEIMGVAILWVFIFHIFPYESTFQYDILKLIASCGYVGVDIFLFVSVFGLYYGYSKYQTKKEFYKKRFFRIVPTYLFFVFFTKPLLFDFDFLNFFSCFFNVGWYLPKSGLPNYDWYMSALMFFYLAFPYYYSYVIKKPLKNTIISIIISLLITYLLATLGSTNSAIFTTRIPIFCIGVYFSYMAKYNLSLRYKRLVIYSFVFLLLMFVIIKSNLLGEYKEVILWNYGFFWIPLIVVVPGLIICLTFIFDKISNLCPRLLDILSFLGMISLEIYLIHINKLIKELIVQINSDKTFLFLMMAFISVFWGYIIHKITAKLSRLYK